MPDTAAPAQGSPTAGAPGAAPAGGVAAVPAPNAQGGAAVPQGGAPSILDGGVSEAQQGGQSGEPKGQETATDPYASVKLPEGADVDQEFFGDVKSWAKESGVKPEGLQKLVDSWSKRLAQITTKQEAEFKASREKQVQGWMKELEGDKNFGGKEFQANISGLQKFLNKVDPDKSFRKEISKAGIGNWPPLVRFLHGISKASTDDSVAGTLGGAPRTPATDDAAFHEELYPTMKKKGE